MSDLKFDFKILLSIYFLFVSVLLAKSSVEGLILKAGYREPVAYASVKLLSVKEEKETYSDIYGKFIFKELEEGRYKIMIDGVSGYSAVEYKVVLKKNQILRKVFFLKESDNDSYTIEVKTKKDKYDGFKIKIEKQDIENIAGINRNFVKLLEKFPGVSRGDGFNSKGVIIRGTASTDSRIFIEGHYIPILFHFSGITPVFNSELIKDMEFYPGNYPLRYGKALGGVVNINIRDAATLKNIKNSHGYIDLNMFDTSLLFEYPINMKSGVIFTFRKSLIDRTFPVYFKTDDISGRLPVFYDWQLKYNYSFTRKNKTSFTLFGSDDKYEFIKKFHSKVLNYDDYSAKTFMITGILNWDFKINKNFTSKSSLSIQYSDNSFKIGEFVKVRNVPYLSIIKEDLSFKLNKKIKLNLGTENWFGKLYYYVDIPYFLAKDYYGSNLKGYGNLNYFKYKYYYLFSAYSLLSLYLKPFNIEIGTRWEHVSYNNSNYLDIGINSSYKINKDFFIKFGMGLYHQPPFEYQTDEDFGNPRLENQYSFQYLLGAYFKIKRIGFIMDLFYNDKNKLVVRTANNYENTGYGKAYGLEILVKYDLKKRFSGWLSYTLMKALYKEFDEAEWRLFDYDQTNILNVVVLYRFNRTFNISFSLRYNTGNPYTPIIGSVLDSDKNRYIPVYSDKNSERFKDFFKIDLKLTKELVFNYYKLKLYIDFLNVTNRKNEEGKIYNYNYSDFKIIQAVPFFPSVGVKGIF